MKSSEEEEEKEDPTKRDKNPEPSEFDRIPEVRRLREDVHSFTQDVRGALSKVGLMGSQSKSSSGK